MSGSELYAIMIFSILLLIFLLICTYSVGHYFGTKGFKNIFNTPLASKKTINILIIIIVVVILVITITS